ncbi:MAG: GNAT family N-acetyltransferase [Pseudomonadota bacterium]
MPGGPPSDLSGLEIQALLHPMPAERLDRLGRLHGLAFEEGWSASSLETLLKTPGCGAFLAVLNRSASPPVDGGFLLYRRAADEAEIITLAVDPALHRGGIGRHLCNHVLTWAMASGITELHLEVAETNRPAIALYRQLGFLERGRRSDYYRSETSPENQAITAILMGRSVGKLE